MGDSEEFLGSFFISVCSWFQSEVKGVTSCIQGVRKYVLDEPKLKIGGRGFMYCT